MLNMDGDSSQPRYMVKSIVHASQVLAAFQDASETLRLCDVVERTGFDKGTAFRLLYTLHRCHFVEKVSPNRYRCVITRKHSARRRIGYASGGDTSLFDRDVSAGVSRAAQKWNVELVMVDNRYSPKVALRSIDRLLNENLELIIEYQTDHKAAPVIAAKCVAAQVPLIAVEIPHPGATFFGANNYEAGFVGGQCLGQWAARNWQGRVDEILLIQQFRAGPLARTRLTGTMAGITGTLPAARNCTVVDLDGDGEMKRTMVAVRNHLRFSNARRILIGAVDDISVLGALRAMEELGRADCCVAVGQNAAPEAREEMRRPGTRLIASVGYFPETYGEQLMRLALDILDKKHVPPAVFVKHKLITPANVDRYYPNDALLRYSV